MKRILLFVWAEQAVLGSAKTALKFKYEIQIGYYTLDAVGSSQIFFPTQNLARAY